MGKVTRGKRFANSTPSSVPAEKIRDFQNDSGGKHSRLLSQSCMLNRRVLLIF